MTGKGCSSILVVLVVSLFCAFQVQADTLYVCRDPSGATRITNVPQSDTCEALGKRTPPSSRFSRPPSPFVKYSGPVSYDRIIRDAGRRYNIDPLLIKAVIKAESNFDSRAVSVKGAQGLMQLMPATARELKVRNVFNPVDNINGGTKYLREMLNEFNGNLILSLAAYNAGPGTVKRAKGMPRIPETTNYVVKVLGYYKNYRRGAGG